MKYGFSRINIRLFTQQVGWLGSKKIEFHPWGPKNQTSQMTCIVVNIEILTE